MVYLCGDLDDLIHWEKYAMNLLFPLEENKSSGILVNNGRRFILYTMHDQVRRHSPRMPDLEQKSFEPNQ